MAHGGVIPRAAEHLRACYGLDYRSLAVFRVLVGLVVLADLVTRFGDAKVLYSDAGVLPRTSAIPILASDRWSVLFLHGSPEFSGLVILIGILAATLMLVGWHTRAATIVLWVVVVSVQARNNHLAYGADTLMRLALFWAMFLPLGAEWSFDRRSMQKPETNVIASVATFGLILQSTYMYLFTALLKDGPRWREDFDAVYYAFGMRDLSTWLGDWLFSNAPMTFFTAFTVGTLWMEFAVPIMLLLPIRGGWLRMIAVVLVLSLQIGIGANMSVGLFPAISVACILVVLPGGFWKFLGATKLAGAAALGRLSPVRMQPHELRPQAEMGGALVPAGNELLRFLPSGRSGPPVHSRTVIHLISAIAISIGLLWNISTVSSYQLPEPLRRTAIVSGLYQDWAMFAPDPRGATVWFVLEGELSSGEKVDLMPPIMEGDFSLRNPLVWDQSSEVQLRNEHWRKYFVAIQSRPNDGLKLAGYACRNWNGENSGNERLEAVTFTVASARTLPNSERVEPAYGTVGTWTCD